MKKILLLIMSICLVACFDHSQTKRLQPIGENMNFQAVIDEAAIDEKCSSQQKQAEIIAFLNKHGNQEWLSLNDPHNDTKMLEVLHQQSYRKIIMPIYSKNKEYEAGVKIIYGQFSDEDHRIKQLLQVSLDQQGVKQPKLFQGEIFIHAETDHRIHYIVNGAYYIGSNMHVHQDNENNDSDSFSVRYVLESPYHLYDSVYAEGNIELTSE